MEGQEGDHHDDEKRRDQEGKKFPRNKGGNLKTTGLEDDDKEEDDDEKTYTGSTGTSTLATAPMTPSARTYNSAREEKSDKSNILKRQRQNLLKEFLILVGMAGLSFFLFLYFYLPFSALVALGMFTSTTSLAIFTIYQRFLLEYDNVVRTRGIGDYLPQSIYVQLTETTVNEWLTDNSFMMEYRYLMLYFMGLSQDRLDEYVERLPPRHRNVLLRHGLGQFFGNDFMRILMGDQRWNPQQQQQQQSQPPVLLGDGQATQAPVLDSSEPPILTIESTSRDLTFDDDDNSDLDLDTTGDELLARGLPDGQAQIVTRDVSRSSAEVEQTVDLNEERQRDIEVENSIINDAFNSLYESTYRTAIQTMSQIAHRATEYASPFLISGGLGLTTLSAGVGIFGVWYGVYDPSSWRSIIRSSSPSPRFPSSRSVLSLFLGGTTTTSFGFLIRRVVRSTVSGGTKQIEKEKKPRPDKKK